VKTGKDGNCCERGSESLGFTKCGDFHGQVRNFNFSKRALLHGVS
jgi:hypothetical protein